MKKSSGTLHSSPILHITKRVVFKEEGSRGISVKRQNLNTSTLTSPCEPIINNQSRRLSYITTCAHNLGFLQGQSTVCEKTQRKELTVDFMSVWIQIF